MSHEATGFWVFPGLLEDTDKCTEVSDEHHVMTKKRASANKNVQQ